MENKRKERHQDSGVKVRVNWLTGNMEVVDIDAMFQSNTIRDILNDSKSIQEALRKQNAA